MQRTRFNTLIDGFNQRLKLLFTNPWRTIALSLIGLLSGFLIGSAITTATGQKASWDILAAGIVLVFTELASKFVYSHDRQARADPSLRTNLILDLLNLVKIGVIYSLFLEAFKLGS